MAAAEFRVVEGDDLNLIFCRKDDLLYKTVMKPRSGLYFHSTPCSVYYSFSSQHRCPVRHDC